MPISPSLSPRIAQFKLSFPRKRRYRRLRRTAKSFVGRTGKGRLTRLALAGTGAGAIYLNRKKIGRKLSSVRQNVRDRVDNQLKSVGKQVGKGLTKPSAFGDGLGEGLKEGTISRAKDNISLEVKENFGKAKSWAEKKASRDVAARKRVTRKISQKTEPIKQKLKKVGGWAKGRAKEDTATRKRLTQAAKQKIQETKTWMEEKGRKDVETRKKWLGFSHNRTRTTSFSQYEPIMNYTLLDAAYEMYYPKAEFAKNPFRKKKKPGLLRRTGRAARRAAGSVVGKTWAGRGVRAAGLLAGAGALIGGDRLLRRKLNIAPAQSMLNLWN